MLKQFISFFLCLFFLIGGFAQGDNLSKGDPRHHFFSEIRSAICEAENNADSEKIASYLHPDAVFLLPEGPPIIGSDAIKSFYDFIFNRETLKSKYKSEGIKIGKDHAVDKGLYISSSKQKRNTQIRVDTINYEWQFKKDVDGWKIFRMTLGPIDLLKKRIPAIPAPNGPYRIGRKDTIFLDKSRTESFTVNPNDYREVGVQIWYPAKPNPNQKTAEYQSREVNRASAKFLGWPLFFNSCFELVETNTSLDSPLASEAAPYPVILYNHGYGGFTSVHQVLFEELASHGYFVVSIGHAFETALFVKAEDKVKAFSSQNQAFRDRSAESSGSKQEQLKDQIIRSTYINEKRKWYQQLLKESPLHQQSTQIWVEDNLFVLSELLKMNTGSGIFKGKMDLKKVGAIGHSLGGATAGQLALIDSNIKAGINLDGFQFGDMLNRNLEKPFMFMGQIPNVNEIFYESSKAPCYLLSVRGFQHSTFSDLALFLNVWDAPGENLAGLRALEIQRIYILAFFNQYLKGTQELILTGPSKDYPEVAFKSRKCQ